jgi:hypothetical protein
MPAFLAWPAIKAFFGGIFGKAWAWLSHRSFWQLVSLGLAIVALFQHFELIHSRHEAAKWQQQLSAQKTALSQTIANYRTAADRAKAQDDAKNARTIQQQQSASQEVANEYEARIAAARREYQRLLATAKANPRSAAGTDMSSISASAGGTAETPSDGLSLTATEQAIQLDELIKWVRAQHAIDPNKEQPK